MIFADLPANWPEAVKRQVGEAVVSRRITALRNAVSMVDALPGELRGRPFKLAILRTFTLEAQIDALKLGLAVIPCNPSIVLGDLENIEQVLLAGASPVMLERPDAILVLWRIEELAPNLARTSGAMSVGERARTVTGLVERISQLCEHHRKHAVAPLFIATLPQPVGVGSDIADMHQPYGWHDAVSRVNQAILELAAKPGQIYVFDFAGWAASQGCGAFDLKMDLYARQPIAGAALMSFSSAVATCMRPLLRPAAKVLVVDLDNLLWGGVVGEDGIQGLKIGQDYPGNVYRRIQQVLVNLRSRGVLLVLLSKNNPQDVVDAFAALSDMPLSLKDFSAMRVNWRPKYENLEEVARELNLGLESFVFADDQAFEREQMAFTLPQVKVLPLSEDPLHILGILASCPDFDVHRVSNEDLARSRDYGAQAQRRELEAASGTTERFLTSLQLGVVIRQVGEPTLPRAVQMLAKTNQFNVTSRRHGEADLRRMCSDAKNILLTLSLSDRFSDQGIVGLAIGVRGDRPDELQVDSFLLSCRALGRGAEQTLWASFVSKATALGYKSLFAEYLRTAKNQQVEGLFDQLGMERIESGKDRSGYRLRLPARAEFPPWINVIDQTL